jgi:hypothetical protein
MERLPAPGNSWRQSHLPLAVLLLALNLVSAALFIGLVNRPVYDDGFNLFDVHNYATQGFSLVTLLSQRNAPGPTSFVWMAAAVRLIGGEELRAARVGAFLSWLLLGLGVLFGARFSNSPRLWYAALLSLLIFPHAVTATATVLTEGPALFFAVMGALVWTELNSTQVASVGRVALESLAALSLGLSVTCRQYYFALLPAATLLVLYMSRIPHLNSKATRRQTIQKLSLLSLAALPVLLLILAWNGASSPGIATGTSYSNYHAGAGVNLTRPIIAALYIALYFVPLTFPLMLRLKSALRLGALVAALLGGMAGGYGMDSLLQPGPVNTVFRAVSRVPHVDRILFGLLVAASIYNAISVCAALWEQRGLVAASTALIFAVLAIACFIGEQFGVGGNIPFYDRYVLQVAPFMGVVAFALLPLLDNARLVALSALSLVSHIMVWRYLFSH